MIWYVKQYVQYYSNFLYTQKQKILQFDQLVR